MSYTGSPSAWNTLPLVVFFFFFFDSAQAKLPCVNASFLLSGAISPHSLTAALIILVYLDSRWIGSSFEARLLYP